MFLTSNPVTSHLNKRPEWEDHSWTPMVTQAFYAPFDVRLDE